MALCSIILSSAILEICAAWYEKLLPLGGIPKKSPVCYLLQPLSKQPYHLKRCSPVLRNAALQKQFLVS